MESSSFFDSSVITMTHGPINIIYIYIYIYKIFKVKNTQFTEKWLSVYNAVRSGTGRNCMYLKSRLMKHSEQIMFYLHDPTCDVSRITQSFEVQEKENIQGGAQSGSS